MQNAENEMELGLVHVCLNISVILTQAADPNVFKTLTAIDQKHVLTTNVKILVLEHAVSMLNVEFKIMDQFVFVLLAMRENLLKRVHQYLSVSKSFLLFLRFPVIFCCNGTWSFLNTFFLKLLQNLSKIHVDHPLAGQTHNAEKLMIKLSVLAFLDIWESHLCVDQNV